MSDPAAALVEFVTYVRKHLTSDEKGEAADFLDHLFRAFGHAGIKEAGATRETRVAKKGRESKSKNYIDLLWPERVLIEMKSRGKKLEHHYYQIFDYWTRIVPHRPPYVTRSAPATKGPRRLHHGGLHQRLIFVFEAPRALRAPVGKSNGRNR